MPPTQETIDWLIKASTNIGTANMGRISAANADLIKADTREKEDIKLLNLWLGTEGSSIKLGSDHKMLTRSLTAPKSLRNLSISSNLLFNNISHIFPKRTFLTSDRYFEPDELGKIASRNIFTEKANRRQWFVYAKRRDLKSINIYTALGEDKFLVDVFGVFKSAYDIAIINLESFKQLTNEPKEKSNKYKFYNLLFNLNLFVEPLVRDAMEKLIENKPDFIEEDLNEFTRSITVSVVNTVYRTIAQFIPDYRQWPKKYIAHHMRIFLTAPSHIAPVLLQYMDTKEA